jgi:hypothetical protein
MYFQPVTVADKNLIQSFTLKSNYKSCYLTFSNLYCWGRFYTTEFAVEDGHLFLRYISDGEYVYVSTSSCSDAAMRKLLDEALNARMPFSLLCFDRDACEAFDAIMPGGFVWTVNRDVSEYLYLRSDLENLAGKHFQPKRNHVNQFLRTCPDDEYLTLTPEIIPECKMLAQQWRKNAGQQEVPEMAASIEAEHNALTAAFEYFTELDLTGAAIRIKGKIIAFTFGAPVNGSVFDICVEKADAAVTGSYAMINRQFARRLPQRFMYINREEDLGIQGLRKAKLSYSPIAMVEKFIGRHEKFNVLNH